MRSPALNRTLLFSAPLLLALPPLHAAAEAKDAIKERAIIYLEDGETINQTLRTLKSNPNKKARRQELIKKLKERSATSQPSILKWLEENGATEVHPLWATNAIIFEADGETILAAAALDSVSRITLDINIPLDRGLPIPAGEPVYAEWNLSRINADLLWARGIKGNQITVALVDSGADPLHPDVSSKYLGGENAWFDPHGEHATPSDVDGHGTNILGLILGGEESGTAIGTAPESSWIAAKIYDDNGNGTLADIMRSYDWLLDPDGDPLTDDMPDVINNSWGFTTDIGFCLRDLEPYLDLFASADIAMVFAAGNFGPGTWSSVSPANNSNAISVGASTEEDTVATFSSRGPNPCSEDIFPDLTAPGAWNVFTSDLTLGGTNPYPYVYVWGTSAAAAHLSGGVALILSAWPERSIAEIEAALKETAVDIYTTGPDDASGYGLIDLYAAYLSLAPADCMDEDNDGYFVGGTKCHIEDCDDSAATIYPGALDIPGDGIDQDCSGSDSEKPASSSGGGGGGCFIEALSSNL